VLSRTTEISAITPASTAPDTLGLTTVAAIGGQPDDSLNKTP